MKSILIIRGAKENFRNSSPEIRIANAVRHFESHNLDEGIREFNKLKVDAEIFIVDSDVFGNPTYYGVAVKEILSENEKLKIRILETNILNVEMLDGINEKVNKGKEEIDLFI